MCHMVTQYASRVRLYEKRGGSVFLSQPTWHSRRENDFDGFCLNIRASKERRCTDCDFHFSGRYFLLPETFEIFKLSNWYFSGFILFSWAEHTLRTVRISCSIFAVCFANFVSADFFPLVMVSDLTANGVVFAVSLFKFAIRITQFAN